MHNFRPQPFGSIIDGKRSRVILNKERLYTDPFDNSSQFRFVFNFSWIQCELKLMNFTQVGLTVVYHAHSWYRPKSQNGPMVTSICVWSVRFNSQTRCLTTCPLPFFNHLSLSHRKRCRESWTRKILCLLSTLKCSCIWHQAEQLNLSLGLHGPEAARAIHYCIIFIEQ